MPWSKAASRELASERVDWVDYAKGWCIILVVMMHSTLGVEDALGRESWLHDFIAFARPFRMPDFFLVAGLFLSRTIDRGWRDFLDRKVLHFVYFFVVWTLIQGIPKFLAAGDDLPTIVNRLAFAMVEPFGTLWFIYLLPIFFVTTKLCRRLPMEAVLPVAAALQMANIYTDSTVVDEFAARYVYFYAGYLCAPAIFGLAEAARAHMGRTLAALAVWALVNGLAVRLDWAALPGVSLFLGFAGAAAVVATSALLAQARILPALRKLGSQSLSIYLAFFLPMALTRAVILGTEAISDPGAAALLVTTAAVLVPIFVRTWVAGTPLVYLFERPQFLRLQKSEKLRSALKADSKEPRAA